MCRFSLDSDHWTLTTAFTSEAPDDSRRTPYIILLRAQIARMHVVSLQPPGKIPERKFVVESTPDIHRKRLIGNPVDRNSFDARKSLHERTELAEIRSEARPRDEIVLADAGTVRSARIHHQAHKGEPGKRNEFERAIPSPETVARGHVHRTGIRNAHVSVPMRDQLG